MKILKLSLFAFLACLVISCSTDPNLTEDQNTITATIILENTSDSLILRVDENTNSTINGSI